MKIKKINVFTPDKVFEAVINKKESYLVELSKGRDGVRYDAVFKIAKRMKMYWNSDPEKRKMIGRILIQDNENADVLYEKIYRHWHEFKNINEYKSNSPFILKYKNGKNIKTVSNDKEDKEIKNRVAKAFFKNNRAKTKKDELRLWLGDEVKTEVHIIHQTVENYYKIKEEPWVLKYRNRLFDELANEKEIQKEKFVKLDATKKKEDKKNKPPKPEKFLSIAKENQILILLGEAGSGKTTTLRHYFKECISKLDNDTPGQKVPVFIKLKRFKEHEVKPLKETLSYFILTSINDNLDKCSKITSEEININSDCILLFDGLDEITDAQYYNAAIEQLQDLFSDINTEGGSEVIITCRPNDYHNNFDQFSCYELKELENDQIEEYLANFLDKNVNVKEIYKNHFEDNPKILDMARNPYLLHVIVRIISKNIKDDSGNLETQPLPPNKGALLEMFVEDICSDQSKKTVNTIDVALTQKFRLLSIFAFDMLDCSNRGEHICPANIRNKIENRYYKDKGITATQTAEILLKAEKERLLKSGSAHGEVEFIHSLIRDYFAAYYINQLDEDELLDKIENKLLEHMKWDSPISMLVGITLKDTSNKIINILTGLDPFFAAQCLSKGTGIIYETEDRLINSLVYKIENSKESLIIQEAFSSLVYMESNNALGFIKTIIKNETVPNIESTSLEEIKSEKTIELFIWILESITNVEYLGFALEMLSEINSEKVFESIIRLMKRYESTGYLPLLSTKLTNSLVNTLVLRKSENVIKQLLELMDESKDPSIICIVLNSLGRIKSKNAVVPLIKLMEQSENKRVLSATAAALGEIKADMSVNTLIRLIDKNEDERVLSSIAIALGKINSEKAVEPLVKLMEMNKSVSVLCSVIIVLGWTKSENNIYLLVKLMEKYKNKIVLFAISLALGRINSEKSIVPLIELMERNKDRNVLCSIARVLRKINSEKAIVPLIELMGRSNNRNVLSSIGEVLGEIKSEKAIVLLIGLMEGNKNESVLCYVAEALGEINSEKAIVPLIELMERNNNKNVLCCVADALGEIKSEKAIVPLIELMERNNNKNVLCCVVGALGKIKSEKAIVPLIELMEGNKNESVLCYVAEALGEIKSERTIVPLIELMKRNNNKNVLSCIADALGEIKSEKAVMPLIDLMERNNNKNVRSYVAEALGKINSGKSLKSLIKLIETNKNDIIRIDFPIIISGILLNCLEERKISTIMMLLKIYEKSRSNKCKEIVYNTIESIKQTTGRRYLKQLKGFP